MAERSEKAVSLRDDASGRTIARLARHMLSGAAAFVLAAFAVQPALAQTAGPDAQNQPAECRDGDETDRGTPEVG